MRYLELVLLTIVLVSGYLVNARAGDTCGTIEKMSGRVEVHRLKEVAGKAGGTIREAILVPSVPFSLLCTDVVATGPASAAKLKLTEVLLSLSANSRISLSDQHGKSTQGSFLELTFGKVRSFFQKKPDWKEKKDSAQFRIGSPAAVSGVRGTDFFVSFDPNTGVGNQAVLKGAIEVQHVETHQKVTVKQGEQVTAQVAPTLESATNLVPNQVADHMPTPKMEVKPIAPSVAEEVRQASVLAKEEQVFQSVEAVKIIGPPDTWKPLDSGATPEDLKGIKNEF